MSSTDGWDRSNPWPRRDPAAELAQRYVARVNLAGIGLGLGLVVLVLVALCAVTRSVFLLVSGLPMVVVALLGSAFAQSGAFITGSRSDLPTVRSVRGRLREGTTLSAHDQDLARELALATQDLRARRRLLLGLVTGTALAGGLAIWWGVGSRHSIYVAGFGLTAFAFVVQFVVLVVVARRIGQETERLTR